LEISQQDFEQLVQQIRELTARVHRLEGLHREQTAPAPEPAQASTKVVGNDVPRQQPTPAPPPPRAPVMVSPLAAPSRMASVPQVIGLVRDSSDLENRIGSHWLNRIGITAVLIGVSYFLKYAFENNWIGAAGRIAIGLIAGISVVLWSERFRTRGYRIFSCSLKAVGIGVLYLSLWASFQVYQLTSAGVSFVCMIVVTAATCVLSLSQDAEILAAFAIAGGFATPALLSTGKNHEIFLFSYLLVLNVGILALVTLKPWRRLLWMGFAGTLFMYMGWYAQFYNRSQLQTTLIFATLFFAAFAIAPILMLRQEGGAGTMPLMFAFANAAAYFIQAYVMITEVNRTAMAWFSLLLAAVYMLLNRVRPRSAAPEAGQNLRLMHLALAVGLITVAIPIRLEAHWITIGWFVEAGALLWVGDRIKSDLLNVFALAALALGVARLLFYDDFGPLPLIFNMRLAIYAIAIAVLGGLAYFASERVDDIGKNVGAVTIVTLNVLALRGLSLEVADYYAQQLAAAHSFSGNWREAWPQTRSIAIACNFAYSALWMGYGAMLMLVGFWRASAFVRWQALFLIAVTIVKVFVYDTSQLDRIYRIVSFVVLGIMLLSISFAYQRNWLKLPLRKDPAEAHPGA
jgi:uncharacterized membrane protein